MAIDGAATRRIVHPPIGPPAAVLAVRVVTGPIGSIVWTKTRIPFDDPKQAPKGDVRETAIEHRQLIFSQTHRAERSGRPGQAKCEADWQRASHCPNPGANGG
jgi:hypothetical protein